jgi:hypothetical protein
MQKIIQIYTCLLKLSHKQESVMDRQTDGQTEVKQYTLVEQGYNFIIILDGF